VKGHGQNLETSILTTAFLESGVQVEPSGLIWISLGLLKGFLPAAVYSNKIEITVWLAVVVPHYR